MTSAESRAHLESILADARGNAESCRNAAEQYKRAANDCDDPYLRRVQFDESSRFFAQAGVHDREAESIAAAIEGLERPS